MLNCKQCNKLFKNIPTRPSNVYCSKKCRGESQKTGSWKYCKNCKKEIYVRPSEKKVKKFCSQSCNTTYNIPSFKNRTKTLKCKICNKEFKRFAAHAKNKKYGMQFCSRKCANVVFGYKKTGRNTAKYLTITINGERILEHRHVMQIHLKRKLLSHEHVHHINGNSKDNRIENLVLLSNSEHRKLEIRQGKSPI